MRGASHIGALADSDCRHQFNQGADARLAGRPATDNPYPSAARKRRAAWSAGWYEVHWHYGLWVGSRWLIRQLPATASPFDPKPLAEEGGLKEAAAAEPAAA